MRTIPTGTRVMLMDPDYGPWYGRVVVCLCKRHSWQQQVGEGGPGRECGHARCGFPPAAGACPWPLHVVWDGGNGESHQGAEELVIDNPKDRPVPRCSGEAVIYSPEYLRRTQGPREGSDPELWRAICFD